MTIITLPDKTKQYVPYYPPVTSIVWKYNGDMHDFFVISQIFEVEPVERLTLKFTPYGRQDKETGFFGLRCFYKLLNTLPTTKCKLILVDPHSLNYLHLLTRYDVECVEAYKEIFTKTIAVDENAGYKYETDYTCKKIRNAITGDIEDIQIPDLYGETHLTVVDDICDGGASFIELRKKIPSEITLDLYVTYGIYSKGKQVLYDAGYKCVTENYLIGDNNGQSIITY